MAQTVGVNHVVFKMHTVSSELVTGEQSIQGHRVIKELQYAIIIGKGSSNWLLFTWVVMFPFLFNRSIK